MAKKRPDFRARLYQGAKRIGPGVYVTRNGEVLWNVVEFHKAHGFPDTPEGRAETLEMIRELTSEFFPEGQVKLLQAGYDEDGNKVPVDEHGHPL